MKTKIISVLIALISLFSVTLAGDLAGFVVELEPSTAKVSEPIDLEVKALDGEGNVLENYTNDILIMVMDGNSELNMNDYVAPNNGIYTFQEQDMGTKLFTKGLVINKEGEFDINVQDFETDIKGSSQIKVVANNAEASGDISIQAPQDGEILKKSSISLAGTAQKYKNSKFEVKLNGEKVVEGLVDEAGNYQSTISDLENGEYNLKIDILDIDGNVVANSKEITFSVDVENDWFKSIDILPENAKKGETVTVSLVVDPKVSGATLNISEYGEYPMEKIDNQTFTTDIVLSNGGKFDINLSLFGDGEEKNYENIKKLVVDEIKSINNVKFERDNNENKILLDWTFSGTLSNFKVDYGVKSNNYLSGVIVNENSYVIDNVDDVKTYFVKVSPVNDQGIVVGETSKELVIEPNMQQAATCNIDNIKTKVIYSGQNSYLTWGDAEGAEKYIISKGKEKENMEKILETTETSYELPYNTEAEEAEYEYFSVKAVCDDGTTKQIDNVKKIKVGPMDILIYVLFITFIIYGAKLAFNK